MPAFATRTGVFKYRRADGSIIRELRHPDEVFSAESMASLSNIPVTNDHPIEALLTAQNTKKYIVGFTSDHVSRDDQDHLSTNVTITDADAIRMIESGKQELSCGYTCDMEETPGTFNGEQYDVIQRNIKYNHLAIVAKGRAGSTVKLRTDSADAEMVEPTEGDVIMTKIKIDGVEFEVKPELAAAIESEKAKAVKKDTEDAETVKKEVEAAKASAVTEATQPYEAKITEKQKEVDTLQARCDALESDKAKAATVVTDDAKVREMVKERMKVEKVAGAVLKDASIKIDSMTDLEIKKAVIAAEAKGSNLEGKSTDYVNARFDHILEGLVEKKAITLGVAIQEARQDAAAKTVEGSVEARNKMITTSQDAWKQPLSGVKK